MQIYNEKRKFSLENRYMSIKDHCGEDDIVVDLDSDDSLIGVYVFQLINTLYQRYPNKWAIYFNYLIDSKRVMFVGMFPSNIGPIPDEVFEKGNYRNSGLWKTSELRTFRKKLFMKIDKNDFLDSKGNFYKAKADGFIHIALVELAGKNHILKIDEPLYYYRYHQTLRQRISPEKKIAHIAIRVLPPYLPLKSLDDIPKRKPDFKVEGKIMKMVIRAHETIDKGKRIEVKRPEYIPDLDE